VEVSTFGCPCCTSELTTSELIKLECEKCREKFDADELLVVVLSPGYEQETVAEDLGDRPRRGKRR
jgi:hypothetical protein